MLQATVWVSTAEDITAIFEELTGSWDVEISKIENKMAENLTIYVKFAFCKGIMCQMHLRYGEPPAYESAQQFLSKLSSSTTPEQFCQEIYLKLGELAEAKKMFTQVL